jgi:hypothetical protein
MTPYVHTPRHPVYTSLIEQVESDADIRDVRDRHQLRQDRELIRGGTLAQIREPLGGARLELGRTKVATLATRPDHCTRKDRKAAP